MLQSLLQEEAASGAKDDMDDGEDEDEYMDAQSQVGSYDPDDMKSEE